MNLLVTELSRVCQDYLLHEKWLITPSLRVGHQWLDSLTSAGCSPVNVRIKTLKGLALELAGPEMARQGVTSITATGMQVIADTILARLQASQSSYLASLPSSPNLAQTLASAINALRLAEITADRLDPICFEAAAKAKDLAFALEEYQSILREKRLVDYADVLRMSVARLASDESVLPREVVVLLPEDLEAALMEKTLLDALPEAQRLTLAVDQPATRVGDNGEANDASLLRWVLYPTDAPEAKEDGTADIFRAVGEINEVRHVLRTCLSLGYRLDEVEILHTDSETYVPLVYETLTRLNSDGPAGPQSVPATFAEGIPARYSRPGRALIAFMGWIREGYPQVTLERMIQDGLLEIPGFDAQEFSFTGVASVFREIPVRIGRERYVPVLAEAAAELEEQLLSADAEEAPTSKGRAVTTKLKATRLLIDLITRLLEICPVEPIENQELLNTAVKFLQDFAAAGNELDNYSLNALLEEIREMVYWTDQVPGQVNINLHDWLASLPAKTKVCGSGPRPGCIHVAHALSGGHSARKHTFIVGLDDGRFPGLGLNDPLLLDQEREKLSPNLRKASVELRMKLERFARMLAGLRGSITLGFSCHNLPDDRETFPGLMVLSAYRIISNNREADQVDMLSRLAPAVSFAPDAPDQCLDDADWWLWRLCGPEAVENAGEVLAVRFPHLGQGVVAARARASAEFTVYDGLLPEPTAELDPCSPEGPIMSASRLETIGRCPLNYFFKYVLDIGPPDDQTLDGTRWLDPLEFGNLLHEVFYRFMSELLSQRRLPLVSRDRPVLMKILDENVERFARKVPPPNPSALRQQIIQLIRAADIFLVEEEELCRVSKPVYLEASIGMRPYDRSGELDTEEPEIVRLPGGKSIRARGRIDRVDLIDDDSQSVYAIWDYKSGSPVKYEHDDVFAQGRLIQHALYIRLAAGMLRRKVSPNAEVKYFGYFFPGAGARGVRIVRWRDQVAAAGRIVEKLCETVARGCFIATENDKEDCKFCDYRPICVDVAAVAECAKLKLQNADNVNLQAVRELRNSGK